MSRWNGLADHAHTRPARSRAQQGTPRVSIAEGTNDDTPAQILQTALDGIGGMGRFVQPGQTVAIKPNATWAYAPHTASSTDPEFLTAVVQAVQAAGAGRIIVMDHCSIEPGAGPSLSISGIGQAVKDLGVEHVFADRFDAPKSTWTKIDLPQGRANTSIGVMKAAVEADVRINLAVAKVHNVTKASMCLKHMMGFLQQPGMLHSNLEQGIADLSTQSGIQAHLHLLEAIRVRTPYGSYRVCAGPETDETNPNVVSRRNIVLAGVDPVLIDAWGCINFFQIQPQELTHVLRAFETGVGDIDVEAALADGRIRRFKVGEPVTSAQPTGQVAASTEPAAPQPTAAQVPVEEPIAQPPAVPGETCPPTTQITNPGLLLNAALIPVAAVLSGVGLLVLKRMRAQLPKAPGGSDAQRTTDDNKTDE